MYEGFIFFIGGMFGMFVSWLIYTISTTISEKKKKNENEVVKVNDILLYVPDSENPFNDNEWNYDIVDSVQLNINGEYYFTSKKCNKDGELLQTGNAWVNNNTKGYRFSNLWKIVGHKSND